MLIAAGCSAGSLGASDGWATASAPGSSGSSGDPTASAVTTAGPVPTTAGPVPTPAVTAAERLAEALAPLRAAARFETTVAVDGMVVVSAVGRSVGDQSRLSVTSADRTVDYVQAPPKAWAREQGGSWVLLAKDQTPAPPMEVLASPATIEIGDGTTFRATYPAAALGLAGDPVEVTITLDGASVMFRYETETGGHRTSSTTMINPGSTDPIATPFS